VGWDKSGFRGCGGALIQFGGILPRGGPIGVEYLAKTRLGKGFAKTSAFYGQPTFLPSERLSPQSGCGTRFLDFKKGPFRLVNRHKGDVGTGGKGKKGPGYMRSLGGGGWVRSCLCVRTGGPIGARSERAPNRLDWHPGQPHGRRRMWTTGQKRPGTGRESGLTPSPTGEPPRFLRVIKGRFSASRASAGEAPPARGLSPAGPRGQTSWLKRVHEQPLLQNFPPALGREGGGRIPPRRKQRRVQGGILSAGGLQIGFRSGRAGARPISC